MTRNGLVKLEATTTELVPFQGGHIEAHRKGERAFVAIKRVCEHLDIDHSRQMRKLKEVEWATVDIMSMVAEDGKIREVACLDLDKFPMWLATIQPTKVKPDARAILVAYQNEAARVLGDHFFGSRAVHQSPDLSAVISLATQQSQMIHMMAQQVNALAEMVMQTQRSHGLAGDPGAAEIKSRLKTCVELALIVYPYEERKRHRRSVRGDLDTELRGAIGYSGRGTTWAGMPSDMFQRALAKLRDMEKRCQHEAKRGAESRQLHLSLVTP